MCFKEAQPRALDHENAYQQVEISRGPSGYVAKSVAPDGIPPYFLRTEGWQIHVTTLHDSQLSKAQGLNAILQANRPEFSFPLSNQSPETMIVGKWYCPFMFVKEEGRLKYQMKRSMFYEVTLKQQWEKIYECENNLNKGTVMVVDVHVQKEVALLFGVKAVQEDTYVVDGVMWFKALNNVGRELSVGLSLAVVERMRWEQERVGWVGGKEKQVRVERLEEIQGGKSGWRKFGCYVLVERFVFKRMDASLFLTYEFRHTHRIQSKWE